MYRVGHTKMAINDLVINDMKHVTRKMHLA